MASDKTVLYYGRGRSGPSSLVSDFATAKELEVVSIEQSAEVCALLNRTIPACLILETSDQNAEMVDLVRILKEDFFTGIIPLVVLVGGDASATRSADLLQAGADEVVQDSLPERERKLRLEQVLKGADRDVSVHPTTRLPGTNHIALNVEKRLGVGEKFAVCYADLDHFKEFNDRYGYQYGDGVIRLLSKILRDIVRGLAPGGFVGYIGGDDFIFNVSVDHLEETCDEIITLFDDHQYTKEDRKVGYFLGKDRRGNIHRIPLMALSIGVVTNQLQDFTHPAMIGEWAPEMKTQAKSLPGSKYVVDQRHQSPTLETAAATEAESLARSPSPAVPTEANT